MGRGTRVAACAATIACAALGAAAPAMAADRAGSKRVVAVDGVSKGDASKRVEILVVVQAGASKKAAADRALAAQNAKPAPPPASAGYTLTGLKWDRLPVVQYYNDSGAAVAGGASALQNTYGDWSSVSGSRYSITSAGPTARCPSLTQGCRGRQRFDGYNDVGWARLSGGTLGVTWYDTSIDEADMAINNRYAWNTGCRDVGGSYDLETVFLHENGHVAGLGHSSDVGAVMYPSYQTARCTLAADDKAGLAALY
jgi:Matrixin